MKSSWLPVIASLFVIIISSLFIKFKDHPTVFSSVPSITLLPSPTLTLTPTPTIESNYTKTYAKCGELPNLSDYSSARFRGDYSLKMWSPSCRFIAWSATMEYSFGQWSASKYEGLFLYDLKTQKTTRIYIPKTKSDSVVFKSWLTNTTFIFHQNIDNTDRIYDVTNQSILLK
jgi:hypothetical protein